MNWKWLVAPTDTANVGNFAMNVTIPPNVVAEIHVPTMPGTLIEQEGAFANVFAAQGGATVITRGSGTHRLRTMADNSTLDMN